MGRFGWRGDVGLTIHTSLMSIQTVGSLWLWHSSLVCTEKLTVTGIDTLKGIHRQFSPSMMTSFFVLEISPNFCM